MLRSWIFYLPLLAGMFLLSACTTAGSAGSDASLGAPATQVAVPTSRLVVIPDFIDANPSLNPPRSHAIYIYLPADYNQSTTRYPVIYFHDGETMFLASQPGADDTKTLMMDVVYDQMIARGQIRPAILVGVAPSAVGRNIELTPPITRPVPPRPGASRRPPMRGGGIEDYYVFLATQLKPYIDAHYRTDPAPASTGICGASLGGLASLYMAYRHPETFGLCLCMSGSLWWDQQKLVEEMETDQSSRNNVRFWIDAGSFEGDTMWKPAQRAAASLVRRGYVEGRDVAFYLDYIGRHEYGQWRAMAPEMYRFILGKQPMTLTGVKLKQVQDPNGRPFSLISHLEAPYVSLELLYTGGYRHNAATPQVGSTDPSLVSVSQEGPLPKLENHAPGTTGLISHYKGMAAQQLVFGYQPVPADYAKALCPHTDHPLDVNAPLNSWPTLTYSLDTSIGEPPPADAVVPSTQPADTQPSTTEPAPEPVATVPAATEPAAPQTKPAPVPPTPAPQCKFGLWEDDKGLYIGIDVIKPVIAYNSKLLPWHQDGLELRIDARRDPVRYSSRGINEADELLLIALSPAPDGSLETLYSQDLLPLGTRISSKRTDKGYSVQVFLPGRYLDSKQAGPWSELRMNLALNAAPADGVYPWKYWWKPDWRTPANVMGSGTFHRVLPEPPAEGRRGM